MNFLASLRALFAAPTVRPDAPDQRILWLPQRQAGMRVNQDTALTFSAVFACTRVISETVAQLPWHVYTIDTAGERMRASASPVERVLAHAPNTEMGAFTFRETLLAWALTWGNGYAEIVRDEAGRVRELWPLPPDRVAVVRDESGMLAYEVTQTNGEKLLLAAADVFHLHGLGFDGRSGYSVVSLAARAIGLGMAADQFGGSYFGNNTILGGILKHPNRLGDEAYERLKASWAERHQGPHNANRPVILEEGMEWQPLGMPMQDAQFLETRKFQIEEICRWFRVPPHKVASLERATFSNIEHQSIEFVQDAIIPWCLRLEQEADRKLFGRERVPGRIYTKLSAQALLRGDTEARAQFYRELWNLGVLSINEIRALEDMREIGPDGDKRFVQLNMTTLERAGEEESPSDASEEEEDTSMADEEAEVAALDRLLAQLDRKSARAAYGLAERYGEDRALFAHRLGRELRKRGAAYWHALSAYLGPSAAGPALRGWIDEHLDTVRAAAFAHLDGEPTEPIATGARALRELLRYEQAA